MVRRIPEMPDVDEPDKYTDDGDDFGQCVAELVKFALERRLLANLRRDRLVDIADGGALAGKDNDRTCTAVHDGCTL